MEIQGGLIGAGVGAGIGVCVGLGIGAAIGGTVGGAVGTAIGKGLNLFGSKEIRQMKFAGSDQNSGSTSHQESEEEKKE
jgi:phage tail tape-measure protein